MKKFILIIVILLMSGSSLTGQVIHKTLEFNPASDTIIVVKPIMHEGITVTTIPILPPTSFQMQIAIPVDGIRTKAPQTRDLKTQIGELLAIGTAMYIFRDELTEFSNKHDKINHGLLAFGLTRYFGWKFAAGFMLSIELTQIDILKLQGRYKDTAGDLLANGVGIVLAWKVRF